MATLLDTPRGKSGTIDRNIGQIVPPTAPVNNTMTGDILNSNENLLKVKPTVPNTLASSLRTDAVAMSAAQKAQADADVAREQQVQDLQMKDKSNTKDLKSIYSELGMQGEKQAKLQQQAGIDEKTTAVTEITNQIASKEQALQKRLDEFDKNPQGLVGQAFQDERNRIEREATREIADLSIIQAARTNTLATAQGLIDKKIALETQDLRTRAEGLKFFYDENKDSLTKKEAEQFQRITKEADREYEDTKLEKKNLEDARLKYIDAGVSLGLGNAVLQKLQSATNRKELLKIVADNNIVTLEDKIKKAQLDELNNKGGTKGGKIVKVNGKDYIQNADGTLSDPVVPQTGSSNDIKSAYQDTVARIDSLLTSKGLYGTVGPNRAARSSLDSLDFNLFTGVRGDFIAGVNLITNQKTIDNLIAVKKAGGTFGALSEKELSLLQQSASTIGSWAIEDENGKVIGYRTTEKAFKEELNRLKETTQRFLDADGGNIESYLDSIDPVLQEETDPYNQAGYNLN